ncbi:hypothetical protein O7626_39530 [Micromonospora sp. WMMD1102]|uniref:hypothetical protein n=1 Tax=Micromonospora sp. WMMD1102 TaxID=3016105 RepID=UPI0024152CAF|nr:hypothetical protein [Micromonospora sp. WMMD1102]MDG4784331.1 hypothetical protein [Micromonospora sp. WMMD1102]MDG4784404.1 hypothetical protein [Micromonospora sp. WMMD1102]MDG4791908.1 hypothetical protein [Micromonospora sp. WMMD1102]
MMVLDDFVMLGTTVPEPNSDGRVFVCSAGYSATLRSLVRVYPLARHGAPARWSVNTVRLERNPRDSRPESYRLAGDRRPGVHQHINRVFEATGTVPRTARAELLRRCTVSSIAEANDRRLSLAILHADAMELEFEHNPASPDSPQLALFDVGTEIPAGARRFPYIPRLRFADDRGPHRLMLRDWGVYELMRKHNNLTQLSDTQRRRYVGEALHLDPSCSLLVGNLNNQRTAWLVISVLRGLRAAPSLFDAMETAA